MLQRLLQRVGGGGGELTGECFKRMLTFCNFNDQRTLHQQASQNF